MRPLAASALALLLAGAVGFSSAAGQAVSPDVQPAARDTSAAHPTPDTTTGDRSRPRRTARAEAGGEEAQRTALQEASDEDPLYDRLRAALKNEYLSVGFFSETRADVQFGPGASGFRLSNARLSLGGTLDQGIGYYLQTEFTGTAPVSPLLDARLRYTAAPALRVDVGLFKTDFSTEFIRGAPQLDIIGRSPVVNALAPNRQLGVAVGGRLREGTVSYSAGIFNDNGLTAGDFGNSRFLYVARGEVRPAIEGGRLQVGANVAYSADDTPLTLNGTPVQADRRLLLGADARFTSDRVLLDGEVIYGDIDRADVVTPVVGAETVTSLGFYVTAGYDLVPDTHQFVVRFDFFGPDLSDGPQVGEPTNRVVLGYNFFATEVATLQANYRLSNFNVDDSQLLLAVQVAF
jgi:hypothetical protein